jgi:hypothetical protein
MVFWVVTLCCPTSVTGEYIISFLKEDEDEVMYSSETLVITYKTTWRHNPQDNSLEEKVISDPVQCDISNLISFATSEQGQ